MGDRFLWAIAFLCAISLCMGDRFFYGRSLFVVGDLFFMGAIAFIMGDRFLFVY
jgi:hypothetical protein